MKSFLEEIDDNPLVWSEDNDIDIDEDDASFSSSSFSSPDDENENAHLEHLEHNDVVGEFGDGGGAGAAMPIAVAVAPAVVAGVVPIDVPQAAAVAPVDVAQVVLAANNYNNDHQDHVQQQQQQQQQVQVVEPPQLNNPPVHAAAAIPPPAVQPAAAAAAAAANNNIQNEMYAGRNNSIHDNLRNHPLSSSLLFRVARCEELPIVRAEIDWKLLQKQIPNYPAVIIGDELGAHLLQSVLRTDPPCEVIRDIIKVYPKSCVNMDSFYAACQYASDDAVQLLMRRTMKARKIEGITWGMLAFLGDARIRIRHAEFLLQCVPEALVDPMHGMFGVSPLDRMISGAFIHGGYDEWVGKLKLALWTAENGSLSGLGSRPFFPFHALIKRLVSSDFMGVQFGALSFANSLTACVEAERPSDPPFHQLDQRGNLPLHIALQHVCDTVLGLTGERKLIKFLLNANPDSVMVRDENGKLPIVLAIENGWPAYDIITNACPEEYKEGGDDKTLHRNLLLHDVLTCQYNQRYGISGARSLIKFLLKKFPSSVERRNSNGCLPLHIGLENGWPCHDLLVAAAPSVLEIRDPRSNFYPFQIVSNATFQVREENRTTTELSALYELIRWGPLVLKGKIDGGDDDGSLSLRSMRGLKRKSAEDSDEHCEKKLC